MKENLQKKSPHVNGTNNFNFFVGKDSYRLMQNLDYSPNVHFKSPLLHDYYMFIEFHHLVNILIHVGNLNT